MTLMNMHALQSLLITLGIIYGVSLLLWVLYLVIAVIMQLNRDPLFLLMNENDEETKRDVDLFMRELVKDEVFRALFFPWALIIHLGHLGRKILRGKH